MAMTPASVGVNQPVMMPPSNMMGIIIGRAADPAAVARPRKVARGRWNPAGPKK